MCVGVGVRAGVRACGRAGGRAGVRACGRAGICLYNNHLSCNLPFNMLVTVSFVSSVFLQQ